MDGTCKGMKYLHLAILVSFLFSLNPGSAEALRTLQKGAKIDDYEVTILSDGTLKKLSDLSGDKGLLVIFWATWSDRSKSLLSFADSTLLPQYREKGINLVGINVESLELSQEENESIEETVGKLALSFPLAIDHGLVMFDEIGVITNPTTLLLNKDLILVRSYPGFPSIARHEMPEMLNDFLGIKEEQPPIRDLYLLSHKPKNKALLRYNLGRNLYKRYLPLNGELAHVPKGVITQLDISSERDPDFYRPYLLKAIIYHKVQDEEEKNALLTQIEEKKFQEHVERIDLAHMYLLIGRIDLAEEQLTILKAEIPDEPEVILLEALVAVSTTGQDDASPIFLRLIAREKARKMLSFPIEEFVEPDTGMIKGEAGKTSRLLSEKALNISKK